MTKEGIREQSEYFKDFKCNHNRSHAASSRRVLYILKNTSVCTQPCCV